MLALGTTWEESVAGRARNVLRGAVGSAAADGWGRSLAARDSVAMSSTVGSGVAKQLETLHLATTLSGPVHEKCLLEFAHGTSGGDWAHVSVLGVAPCRCTNPRGVRACSNGPVHPRPRVHHGAIWVVVAAALKFPPNMVEKVVVAAAPEFPLNMVEKVVVAAAPEFPPNMAERVVVAATPEFPPNMMETCRRPDHRPAC